MKIRMLFVIIVSLLLASCNNASTDVYLFRVIDNYPKQVSKEKLPQYHRFIKLQFWLKNDTRNKMFIPLNITYGCSEFKSSIKVLSSKGRADNVKQSMKGGNRCIVDAGQEVNIELVLYQDDLDKLGFARYEPTKKIMERIKFTYDKQKEDNDLIAVPNLVFHNNNIKQDMRSVCQESSQNWNVDFDLSHNIVYCYVIPGRKVQEIRSVNR